jgi:methionyl-tRNA formyltransferase
MLYRAVALTGASATPPGRITTVTKDAIHVATGEGILAVKELQPANSRRMTVAQYLAGHPIQAGLQLGQQPIP